MPSSLTSVFPDQSAPRPTLHQKFPYEPIPVPVAPSPAFLVNPPPEPAGAPPPTRHGPKRVCGNQPNSPAKPHIPNGLHQRESVPPPGRRPPPAEIAQSNP